MKDRRKVIIFSLFLAVILSVMAFAQESPQLPHLFYGNAYAESTGLPSGSVIIAKVADAEKGRIITAEAGKYGGPSASGTKLLVQGNIAENAQVEFFVSGVKANEVAQFKSGKIENKNLTWAFPPTISISALQLVNNPVTCLPYSGIIANVSGLLVNITCGNATAGTINNITNLGSQFLIGAPAPSGIVNISNIFEINISGNLTIVVTIGYNDAGVNESTITVYKFVGGAWVPVPSSDIISVDTVNNLITFRVAPGGTPYTAFGSPPLQLSPPLQPAAEGGGAAAGLSLSISAPDSVTIQAGASSTFSAVVTANNRNATAAILSVSGLPTGFASNVAPSSVNIRAGASQTFNVTISVPAGEPARTVMFTLTARSGTASASRNVDMVITVPAAATTTLPPAATTTTLPTTTILPPGGVTGFVTANPVATGLMVIVAVTAVYILWRIFKSRKKGGKVIKPPTRMKVKLHKS